MRLLDPAVYAIATALGVGLLIGIERERSKGTGPQRGPGGVRTFALVALAGALAGLAGEGWLVAAGLAVVGAYGTVAYLRASPDDPGLTTEVALVVTYLVGALAMHSSALAAGVGVVVAIVLAARSRLHRFVRERLSERELDDGLLLAAAALVVLPLLPDRAIDPWGVLNPHVIWLLAVLVMAINAAGYVALRTLGVRRGLPLAGLAAGFVSSTATHGAMGSRARAEPQLLGASAAGAALSSVATVVQMLLILGITNLEVLRQLVVPMLLAGVAAVGWGTWNTFHSLRAGGDATVAPGRAFDVRTALVFTGTVTIVMLAAALLTAELGSTGGVVGVIVAGLADTHAAAASGAQLAATGRLEASQAAVAVLGAFSVNSGGKLVVSYATGGTAFGNRVLPGLVAMVALAWLGAWVVSLA
jgi:uncharacterized membrane protein (DUF4010 family)